MSTVLHPVGPRPGRVYWVRRLVVVGVVVALLIGLSLVVRGLAARSSGQETGETTTDAGAAPQDDGGVPTTCAAADLTVALTTDSRTYPAGAQPTFDVAITNVGASACTLDVGEAQREIVVTSGSDRIWSSADCPAGGAEDLRLVEAGGRHDAVVPWARVRSAAGCPADLPEPKPGTYSAVVTVLGTPSAAAVFELG